MQIWKDSKYAFQEKQGRGGGVRQSGKFPDYTGFFLLKASLMHIFITLGIGYLYAGGARVYSRGPVICLRSAVICGGVQLYACNTQGQETHFTGTKSFSISMRQFSVQNISFKNVLLQMEQ